MNGGFLKWQSIGMLVNMLKCSAPSFAIHIVDILALTELIG